MNFFYRSHEYRNILNELKPVYKPGLETRSLERMIKEAEDEQTSLSERAKEINRTVKDMLSASNHQNSEISEYKLDIKLRELQDEARDVEQQWKTVNEKKKDLYNELQERLIREKAYQYIGKTGYKILEVSVLVLIIVVLSLMSGGFIMGTYPIEFFWIDFAACLVFQFEFFFRLNCCDDKSWFWKSNWIDFASSIPIPPTIIPLLLPNSLPANSIPRYAKIPRFIRIARMMKIIRALRIARFLSLLWRGMGRMERQTMEKAFVSIVLMIFLGTIGLGLIEGPGKESSAKIENSTLIDGRFVVEGGTGADSSPIVTGSTNIVSGSTIGNDTDTIDSSTDRDSTCISESSLKDLVPDKYEIATTENRIWWAFTTLVTGGFADLHNPSSNGARVLTAIIVLVGAVVWSVLTAVLASIFFGDRENKSDSKLLTRLDKLEAKIDGLTE